MGLRRELLKTKADFTPHRLSCKITRFSISFHQQQLVSHFPRKHLYKRDVGYWTTVGARLLERPAHGSHAGLPRTGVARAIWTPSPAPRDLGGSGTCPMLAGLDRWQAFPSPRANSVNRRPQNSHTLSLGVATPEERGTRSVERAPGCCNSWTLDRG